MANKNSAFKGFTIGVLAALVIGLSVWPAVAYGDSYLALSAKEKHQFLSSYPSGPAAGSPVGPELNEAGIPGEVGEQSFDGPPPLIIPAAAFSDSGTASYDNYKFWPVDGYVRSAGNNTGLACLAAPVYLPDGATIENLYGYLYDNTADDFTVSLWRKRNSTTDDADELARVPISGASPNVRILGDNTIVSGAETVDNRNYSYYVSTCLSSSSVYHRIYAIWIYYTGGKVFLPLIIKNS